MKNYLVTRSNRGNEMDFFDNAFESLFRPFYFDNVSHGLKTDITETENGYLMEVEVAGFDKKDISMTLEDGYLTISANKEDKHEEGKKSNYIRRERSLSYSRSYYVGDVQESEIKARYSNGVLSVEIPHETQKRTAGKIEIE